MAVEATSVAKAGTKVRILEKDIAHKSREAMNDHGVNPDSPSPSTFDTPRASSASRSTGRGSTASTPKYGSRSGSKENPKKYVSPMARAREEKKRREAQESNGKPKDWPTLSDMETSSNPSSTESGSVHSDMSTGRPLVKTTGATAENLPKFGEWNNHAANSGPCYTILFQKAAQEKKIGGPIRVHGPRPSSPSSNDQDLYNYTPVSVKAKKKKQYSRLLCCFSS